MAAVLVGIILLFIVCHSFKFVVNAYEAHLTYSSKCNCCCFHIANPLDFSIQLTSVAAILNYLVTHFYLLCNAHIRFLYHRISALVLITVDQRYLVHITIFGPSHRCDLLLKLQSA